MGSNNIDQRLVNMYQEAEFLWNEKHRDYFNKIRRQMVLEHMGASVGLSVPEVKSRIRSARNRYIRERNVFLASQQQGESDQIKSPTYWLYHQFDQFLADHINVYRGRRKEKAELHADNSTEAPDLTDHESQPSNNDNSIDSRQNEDRSRNKRKSTCPLQHHETSKKVREDLGRKTPPATPGVESKSELRKETAHVHVEETANVHLERPPSDHTDLKVPSPVIKVEISSDEDPSNVVHLPVEIQPTTSVDMDAVDVGAGQSSQVAHTQVSPCGPASTPQSVNTSRLHSVVAKLASRNQAHHQMLPVNAPLGTLPSHMDMAELPSAPSFVALQRAPPLMYPPAKAYVHRAPPVRAYPHAQMAQPLPFNTHMAPHGALPPPESHRTSPQPQLRASLEEVHPDTDGLEMEFNGLSSDQSNREQEEASLFGKLVEFELRKIKGDRKRHAVKIKILQLLYEAHTGGSSSKAEVGSLGPGGQPSPMDCTSTQPVCHSTTHCCMTHYWHYT